MFLPKAFKKFALILLLTCFFLLISQVVAFANNSSTQATPNPANQSTSPGYMIVPIPPANGNPQVTPIPTATQTPNIQLAVDIPNPIGWLKDRTEDLVGLLQDATMAAVQGALYVVEHTVLLQIGGSESSDIVAAASTGDVTRINQTLKEIANSPNPNSGFGLIGIAQQGTSSLLALPLPVSSRQYFASINPFAQANAESGESTLKGGDSGVILNIWKKVRDAALSLSVVVLIIIGFMIMLRIPLNPRTVVTLQNSLPRIVIALILITFSFAIAGLMVDLTRVLAAFLDGIVSMPNAAKVAVPLIFATVIGLVGILVVTGPPGGTVAAIAFFVLLLFALILAIIILVVFMTLIYKLLTRYVIFLLLTLFAPIFFLVGALPQAEGAVIAWFRRAAAALIAIPATSLVLKLSFAIGFGGFPQTGNVLPEFQGLPLDLFGGTLNPLFSWIWVGPFVGLALFFFATKVPDIVDELFGSRPLGARAGIGPGAILGAPMAGFMTAGKVGKAWTGTSGMRETAGRFLNRAGSTPYSVEKIDPEGRFRGGQPLSTLSSERRKALEPDLRKAGAVFTDTAGTERIKAGTEITIPAEPKGGIGGGLARRAAGALRRATGVEGPPTRISVKTPEQIEKEVQQAKEAAWRSPGQRGRRSSDD